MHSKSSWFLLISVILVTFFAHNNKSLAQEVNGKNKVKKNIETIKLGKLSFHEARNRQKQNSLKNRQEELKFNLSNTLDRDFHFEPVTPTQISSSNGSPSLRRMPTEGEQKFEPQRIPFVIPKFNIYKASPGITIINPSGYGASWGSAGIGFGLQERTRFRDQADGVFGLGFGLGDAQKNVGVQFGVTLVDLTAPFRDGTVNVKIHRRLPNDFNVALGAQGLVTWGNTDGGSSVYGVVTKRFALSEDRSKPFSELYASVGIGGGQFRSESDIDDGINSIGVFSSVAVKVLEPMSVITEWTGQDLTMGVSIVPFRNLPLVIVPAITDITGTAGDGARFIFGFGYGFSF